MNSQRRCGSLVPVVGISRIQGRRAPVLALSCAVVVVILMLWNPGIQPDSSKEIDDFKKISEISLKYSEALLLRPERKGVRERAVGSGQTSKSSDFHHLINLSKFNFSINHQPCNTTDNFNRRSSHLLLLILVHSNPYNWAKRQVIRETWGSWARVNTKGFTINLLFLLGDVSSRQLQERINMENQRTEDIIQGSFLDSYRNLTYKHVMGLKWSTYFCPSATFVLKTDDDVFVNTPALVRFLVLPRKENFLRPNTSRFILCNRIDEARVKRSYRSKWHVRPSEYSNSIYPSYCMGCVILYSYDVVKELYREAQATPFFWVDDVHVTGTLASQLNITQTQLGNLMLTQSEVDYIISNPDAKAVSSWFPFKRRIPNVAWGENKDPFLFGTELGESDIRNLWKIVNSHYY